FAPRVHALRAARDQVLRRALEQGVLPAAPSSSAAGRGDWRVPPVPDDLKRPGIEISGPCSITSMFINALNPGPEGERAEGDLDDDEDSAGHRLIDTVRACHNRVAAVNRELQFTDRERNREYRIADGELPFFMHRERGLHLDEPEVTIDGAPVPPAVRGTAVTLYYPGRAQADRGQGIYFYLPKVESAEECAWYRDLFDRSRELLPFLKTAVIRAIPLVESLPAVYQMDEMLHALGPYGAGLNAARWDLKASIFEFVMADPKSVWPDRFRLALKTPPFLPTIFPPPIPREHLPPARRDLLAAWRGAHRRHGHGTAQQRPGGEPRRGGGDPERQDLGGRARLHPRLGRAHLPHEDRCRPVPGAARPRLCVEAAPGDARSGSLPDRDRGAGRADHRRGHAPKCADADRVPGGLAERPRRQRHRQPRRQAGHSSRADGRSGDGAHVGGPDRPAGAPSRQDHRRPTGRPRFPAGEDALAGGVRRHPGATPRDGEGGRGARRLRGRGDAVQEGCEDRDAVGQELHGARLPEPRHLHPAGPRSHRRGARRFLAGSEGGSAPLPNLPQMQIAPAEPALDHRTSDPGRRQRHVRRSVGQVSHSVPPVVSPARAQLSR